MSLRSKYLGILSDMVPAGALGVLLLLSSAAPCDAGKHPSNSLPSATPGGLRTARRHSRGGLRTRRDEHQVGRKRTAAGLGKLVAQRRMA